MRTKLAMAIFIFLASLSSLAQVQPAGRSGRPLPQINFSAGAGMDYFSGDWGRADINRWGPAAWISTNWWHCLGINVEEKSMIVGGNDIASKYKLFIGEGGLMCTMGYWGRFQPIYKGQVGIASLTQPGNGTGHLHSDYATWSIGGGAEYHTKGHWWTRVEYTYEVIPSFHSSISNQNHSLDPRGITFGETYRFGPNGATF